MNDAAAPSILAQVRVDLDAYCWDCRVRHRLGCTPQDLSTEIWEWEAKHAGHVYEFLSPRRRFPRGLTDRVLTRLGWTPWWLSWRENANIRLAYAASAAITIGLASLATSATFVAGRESTAVDNSSNLYVDYRITARIMTGTTPTVNLEIRIYGYAALSDTPTYPDTLTGSDANATLTNTYVLDAGFVLLGSTSNAATSNVSYPIRCITLAEAFGHAPKRWGLYVTHNTVAALNATAGNHVVTQIGAYFTST